MFKCCVSGNLFVRKNTYKTEFFSSVNGVPLHTSLHFHTLIVLKWLKYCWKDMKLQIIRPSIRKHIAVVPGETTHK